MLYVCVTGIFCQWFWQLFIHKRNLTHWDLDCAVIYRHRPWSIDIDLGNSLSSVRHTLQWRHNRRDSVLNHQPHDCLLNRLFRRRSKKISQLRVTGLCAGNSPGTGEFPAQMASNAENVSIWWRHPDMDLFWLIVNWTLFSWPQCFT